MLISGDTLKLKARDLYVVTGIENEKIKVTKIINSSQNHDGSPKWSANTHKVENKFIKLYRKRPDPCDSDTESADELTQIRPGTWIPVPQQEDSDSNWIDTEDEKNDLLIPLIQQRHTSPPSQMDITETLDENPPAYQQQQEIEDGDNIFAQHRALKKGTE